MTTTTEVQKLPEMTPELKSKLEVLKQSLPEINQLSWLQLGVAKATTKSEMQKLALKLQSVLTGWDKMSLENLQNAIVEYKKGLAMMPEIRKAYTRFLDIISNELMSIQKAAESYEELSSAEKRFLELRKEKEKEDQKLNDKIQEAARFKAHVKNEYLRVQTEYIIALKKTISDSYLQALRDDLTEDGLKKYIDVTKAALADVKIGGVTKFTPYNHHTPEELTAIHKTIEKPDYAYDLSSAVASVDSQFVLYWNDKKAGEKAKEYIQNQQKNLESELKEHTQTASAVNELISKASSAEVLPDPNIKSIKRKVEIVVKDNDPQCALIIIANFVKYFQTCKPRLKVTKWGNLSVKQMAAALQEEDIMIEGLEYNTIEK